MINNKKRPLNSFIGNVLRKNILYTHNARAYIPSAANECHPRRLSTLTSVLLGTQQLCKDQAVHAKAVSIQPEYTHMCAHMCVHTYTHKKPKQTPKTKKTTKQNKKS